VLYEARKCNTSSCWKTRILLLKEPGVPHDSSSDFQAATALITVETGAGKANINALEEHLHLLPDDRTYPIP